MTNVPQRDLIRDHIDQTDSDDGGEMKGALGDDSREENDADMRSDFFWSLRYIWIQQPASGARNKTA
jgi:hypothetical protein